MDRPDELRAALASVRRGTAQPWEIIVSDDGETSVAEIAAEFGARYVKGPRRGLGANRNRCLEEVAGDLVAFIDDDVIVSEDFIARASESPTDSITTGWEQNFSTEPSRAVHPSNSSFLGFQQSRPSGGLRAIVINSTVFPAAVFDQIRFSELARYGYEELDVARHATSRGWTITPDEHLWVEHHPSAKNRAGYNSELDVSRICHTYLAYREYDRRPAKALLFLAAAGAHLFLGRLRHRQSPAVAASTLREVRRRLKERHR